MKCEKCGKNEATTFFKETQNGSTHETHLCDVCASHLGFTNCVFSQSFGYGAGGYIPLIGGSPFVEPPAERTCSTCGLRESALRRTGRVGCADCYRTFSDILTPYLQKIHGALTHIGDAPQALQTKDPVGELRGRLQGAVAAEDYEQAARLRDEIRRLEGEQA